MSKVVLDDDTLAKLNGLADRLELYDRRGNLLAYCLPADPGLDTLPTHTAATAFTAAEIEEAARDTDPGRPLADILAELRRS